MLSPVSELMISLEDLDTALLPRPFFPEETLKKVNETVLYQCQLLQPGSYQ